MSEIPIEEIMQKIKEEATKKKNLKPQEEVTQNISIEHHFPETTPIIKATTENTQVDKFLWKYGTRYAKIINKIPLLKSIAKKQYMELARKQIYPGASTSTQYPNEEGLNFVERNWYYHDFFEQTKKEGMKGRLKLFILKSFGFFAWWQGQINRTVYQEMIKLNDLIENRTREVEGIVNHKVEGLLHELKEVEGAKANKEAVNEIKQEVAIKADRADVVRFSHELKDVKTLKADKAAVDGIRLEVATKADKEEIGKVSRELNEVGILKADKVEIEGLRHEIKDMEAQKTDKVETARVNQELKDFLKQIRDLKLNILDQQRRLSLLLEEARQRLPDPITTGQIENMLKENDHFLDAMYVTLEDRFRGTREDIKEKLKIYLPYISTSKVGTKESPILDVGCGRGEWLELLKENGYIGQGLDFNRIMVDQCQELELDVIGADAIEYLRKQNSNTFGAITGFHIVEHLPLNILITLFDESLRVLRHSGIVIFETPNPENLIVGACNFYLDPTHLNPIPPSTLEFLIEARGFLNIKILRSRPMPFSFDNEMVQNLLFGTTDYAVIGYKQ